MPAIKRRSLYQKKNLLEAIRVVKEKKMTSVKASEFYHKVQFGLISIMIFYMLVLVDHFIFHQNKKFT